MLLQDLTGHVTAGDKWRPTLRWGDGEVREEVCSVVSETLKLENVAHVIQMV